jgi:hypothetical protein
MQNKSQLDNEKKAASRSFDPFNDRLSRDIRNSLSDALVASLKQRKAEVYLEQSRKWFEKKPVAFYSEYIQDRIRRYDLTFQKIQRNHLDDARIQALILWNHGLFFEVHDILEDIWHKTQAEERQAIKGLIKAAGVYVHLEYNRSDSAERLAVKAAGLLRKYAGNLGFISNLNALISALKTCNPLPPILEYSNAERRE